MFYVEFLESGHACFTNLLEHLMDILCFNTGHDAAAKGQLEQDNGTHSCQ